MFGSILHTELKLTVNSVKHSRVCQYTSKNNTVNVNVSYQEPSFAAALALAVAKRSILSLLQQIRPYQAIKGLRTLKRGADWSNEERPSGVTRERVKFRILAFARSSTTPFQFRVKSISPANSISIQDVDLGRFLLVFKVRQSQRQQTDKTCL